MTDEEKTEASAANTPKRRAAPKKQTAPSTPPPSKPDQPSAADETPPTPAVTPPPPPPSASPAAPANAKTSPLGSIALVLVIILGGIGFYLYQQLRQQIDGLDQSVSQVDSNQGKSTEMLEQRFSDLSDQLQQYSEATDAQIDLLEKQTSKNKRQWLIVEAEYLASVANVRLQLAQDVRTSIAALQAADQRLKDHGSPSLFSIRQQIAKEIGALQSAAMPDVVGLSSRILSLESRVGALKVSDPHTGVAQAPGMGGEGVQPAPENWEKALQSAWDNFSKMVVVRRNDKPISAMMTPEQVDVIQKNLALKLETARLALVHQDEDLYRASLDIVAQWLTDYFDVKQHDVSAALTEVSALRGERVMPEMPDIGGSLMMLRDLPVLQFADLPVVAEPEEAEAATNSEPEAKPAATDKADQGTGSEAAAPAESAAEPEPESAADAPDANATSGSEPAAAPAKE